MTFMARLERLFVDGVSGFFKAMFSDTITFLKIIAPILLLVSFATVLNTWLDLRGNENATETIREVLNVPLMLFGVIAIINVMIFREASSSTFLAVFFIGTVIAGPEVADKALRATTSGAVYENSGGGLGYLSYEGGGLLSNGSTESKSEMPATKEGGLVHE